MGEKRLSKEDSVFFHFAICIGVILFLSGCNGAGSRPFHKDADSRKQERVLSSSGQEKFKIALAENAKYIADLENLERVQGLIEQEKFKSALAENVKLESYYDYSTNQSGDYDRVIRVYARMNTSLLKKMIQDEKNLLMLSKEVQEKDLVLKNLNLKLQSVTLLLKEVERLDAENKTLRQQIKDFKEIDLEGGKINADIQK